MSNTKLYSSVWIIYLLIIFEILFMISPLALYYYSAYGPVLNTFHSIPGISWLSSFFMPHFSESRVWFFNNLFPIGASIFFMGMFVFIISAGQIYYAKFRQRGAVTTGIYRYVRHPQYSAFFIMGLGTLLIWPRFLILLTYVTMIFLYYMLASREERICREKFGNGYQEYVRRTAMFFPGDSFISNKIKGISLPISLKRILGVTVFVIMVLLSIHLASVIQDYSISSISVLADQNSATISTVKMEQEMIRELLYLIYADSQVVKILGAEIPEGGRKMLNYIVPAEWILPDLPLDDNLTSRRGHQQPADYNRDRYKILLTRSVSGDESNVVGLEIIKRTIRREPLLVVYVDQKMRSVIDRRKAPATVLWGDIPTPIF